MGARMMEVSFSMLSVVGFILLWVVMVWNGTVLGLLKAAWNGAFLDGRPLLTKYTYIWPVDFNISVVVAFFDSQVNGKDPGAWLLMFDLLATLQTAALWVLVEGSRKGNSKSALRLFAMWPLLWNLFGAAFILSLWFYVHTKVTYSSTINPSLPLARARALMPTMVLSAFPPALTMLFAHRFTGIAMNQAIIGLFQFFPLVIGATVHVVSWVLPNRQSTVEHDSDSSSVRKSYIFSGLVSTAAHIYTLAITVFSNEPSTAFKRVFVPAPSKVILGSVDNIHDGAFLFLQYDWIIINLACCLWVYSLVDAYQTFLRSSNLKGKASRMSIILLLTLMLGPGGTVCGTLWFRELKLRTEYARSQALQGKGRKIHR